MSKDTSVEVLTRFLDFLSNIKESDPVSVSSFVERELTGDQTADKLLSETSLMMFRQLKRDGMIIADDLTMPNAKIYGLTEQGFKMKELFLDLAYT